MFCLWPGSSNPASLPNIFTIPPESMSKPFQPWPQNTLSPKHPTDRWVYDSTIKYTVLYVNILFHKKSSLIPFRQASTTYHHNLINCFSVVATTLKISIVLENQHHHPHLFNDFLTSPLLNLSWSPISSTLCCLIFSFIRSSKYGTLYLPIALLVSVTLPCCKAFPSLLLSKIHLVSLSPFLLLQLYQNKRTGSLLWSFI